MKNQQTNHFGVKQSRDQSLWQRSRIHPLLKQLAGVVLMAGSVRPTPFHQEIGRSILDLPLDLDGTILHHWQHQGEALAAMMQRDYLELKVMVDASSLMPTSMSPASRVAVTMERDPLELRGTGGVLHDLARRFDDDDYLLVASARQVLLDPLPTIANAMAAMESDVVLVSHHTGVPSGLMLLRCGCLRDLSPVGFVDMKEQALSQIAKQYRVKVLHHDESSGVPVRTLGDYIQALRMHHQIINGIQADPAEHTEDWRLAFSLTEPGAAVHPDARIHDSVVLSGAQVQAGAVVVRSIICPGAVVRHDQMIVDECVVQNSA